MARNYANVSTAIWRDDDFRKLTATAQRMYLLALSQSDISAAGVLALRLPRWAAMAVDTTTADVQAAIDELQASRHVLFDEIAGELLVRSFVKWDAGYGNTKRRPVIRKAALEVESPMIRCAIAVEFERLGLKCDGLCDRHPDGHPHGHPQGYSEPDVEDGSDTPDRSEIRETDNADDKPGGSTFAQENRLSDAPCHSPSDGTSPSEGVVVTKGPYLEPTTHNPQTTTPPSVRGAKRAPTKRATRIPDDFTVTPEMVEWAQERVPHVDGRHETEKFVNYWRAKSGGATKLDWPATWRNWMLTAGERTPSNVFTLPINGHATPNGRRPSATDRAVAEGLAVVAQLEALEALEAEQARKEINP